jgi:hypothetical protein
MRPFPHHPATFVNDPDHWRDRADYIRWVAAIVDESEMKSTMLRIAAEYDRLVKKAEERVLDGIPPARPRQRSRKPRVNAE